MTVRFFIDPATEQPHIYGHAVLEEEVEDVLARPMEDRAGRDGSRIALGQTEKVGDRDENTGEARTGGQGVIGETPGELIGAEA